jgi:hypothetical protein
MHLSIKNIKDEAAAIVFFSNGYDHPKSFHMGQQKEGFFHLDEILQLALVNAPELKLSNSDLRESQLSLKSLQERFKPQVFLNGTLPGLSRSIEPIALPDGRDAFVNRSSMFNRLGLRVSYQLESTGGTIFAESNLDRWIFSKRINWIIRETTSPRLFPGD